MTRNRLLVLGLVAVVVFAAPQIAPALAELARSSWG